MQTRDPDFCHSATVQGRSLGDEMDILDNAGPEEPEIERGFVKRNI